MRRENMHKSFFFSKFKFQNLKFKIQNSNSKFKFKFKIQKFKFKLKIQNSNSNSNSKFTRYAWGGMVNEYTEAAGYQYRFYVPHDPEGLAKAYSTSAASSAAAAAEFNENTANNGAAMCSALNEMMTTYPVFHLGSWGLHHEQVGVNRIEIDFFFKLKC